MEDALRKLAIEYQKGFFDRPSYRSGYPLEIDYRNQKGVATLERRTTSLKSVIWADSVFRWW